MKLTSQLAETPINPMPDGSPRWAEHHTATCRRLFGRRDPECGRCRALADGADTPRRWQPSRQNW